MCDRARRWTDLNGPNGRAVVPRANNVVAIRLVAIPEQKASCNQWIHVYACTACSTVRNRLRAIESTTRIHGPRCRRCARERKIIVRTLYIQYNCITLEVHRVCVREISRMISSLYRYRTTAASSRRTCASLTNWRHERARVNRESRQIPLPSIRKRQLPWNPCPCIRSEKFRYYCVAVCHD